MKEFFANMDTTQQFYWYIAIGSSVIFIIQTIMTFVGASADGADVDTGFDGADHPFQLFSLRNLVSFLLGFGWTGVSFYHTIDNKILLGVVAFIVGVFLIAIFFFIMKGLMKLAEDNSFKIEDTIGQIADVYVTIPASKKGKGKVFISVKGTTHELQAITTNSEAIKNGVLVKVIAIEGDVLVVERLDK